MKSFYAILCIVIATLTQLQAQAPQGFNYQATVRNSAGDLIVNTNVYFKFNVMQGSQTSLPVKFWLDYKIKNFAVLCNGQFGFLQSWIYEKESVILTTQSSHN